MYSYSIMIDVPGHEDEICLDVKRQYEEGIADCVLFPSVTVYKNSLGGIFRYGRHSDRKASARYS